MKLNGTGGIQIQTTVASGAYPLSGVSVRIRGAEEKNRYIAYTARTGINGNTPIITLPTPQLEYSLKYGAHEQPYASYDVEIDAEGYYSKTIRNVAVFPNTVAIQPINMIALSENMPYENYPIGNLNATVRENSNLE